MAWWRGPWLLVVFFAALGARHGIAAKKASQDEHGHEVICIDAYRAANDTEAAAHAAWLSRFAPRSGPRLEEQVKAVLVQGAINAAAPVVVWNLRARLGASFPLQVFYTLESGPAVKRWFGDDPHTTLTSLPGRYFTALGSHIVNRDALTSVFTDDAFWAEVARGFAGTHVLTIQDECVYLAHMFFPSVCMYRAQSATFTIHVYQRALL